MPFLCAINTANKCQNLQMTLRTEIEILLPSARHLEEGRGTNILELLRLENCISRLCPRPLGSHPPQQQHPNRVKNT